MTQAVANLTSHISGLEYLIYNSSGQLVKDTIQYSSVNLGTINLQLPAGSYKLVVAGMSNPFKILDKESSGTSALFKSPPYGIGDWFKQASDFTVTDQALNQSIVLDRVVGKVGFVLTDAIPKDIASVSLSFTSGSFVYLNSPNVAFYYILLESLNLSKRF